MMTKTQIREQIKAQGILPLFYHDDAALCLSITKALYAAGIRCIEFTNRGKHALKNFEVLLKERNEHMQGLLLGVGTIKTSGDAARFIAAGADFLISPVFDAEVNVIANTYQMLWIPGCMTPTEVHVAVSAGCDMIKLFPGNTLGPGFVEAIKPLFRNVDLLVTGGVDATEESIRTWYKAGVAGVGMGSKLITKDVLETGDVSSLQSRTVALLQIVRSMGH